MDVNLPGNGISIIAKKTPRILFWMCINNKNLFAREFFFFFSLLVCPFMYNLFHVELILVQQELCEHIIYREGLYADLDEST